MNSNNKINNPMIDKVWMGTDHWIHPFPPWMPPEENPMDNDDLSSEIRISSFIPQIPPTAWLNNGKNLTSNSNRSALQDCNPRFKTEICRNFKVLSYFQFSEWFWFGFFRGFFKRMIIIIPRNVTNVYMETGANSPTGVKSCETLYEILSTKPNYVKSIGFPVIARMDPVVIFSMKKPQMTNWKWQTFHNHPPTTTMLKNLLWMLFQRWVEN